MWRRCGVIQAVEDGPGNCLVQCAAEHGEPPLLVITSGKAMCQVSALGRCRERVNEGHQRGTKPAPSFDSARCDTPTFRGRAPNVFVMLSIDGSGPRDERGKPCTVGGHGVPDCCIEKEFSSIKGVRGNNIQDALRHLAVFPRAEARGDLVRGTSWLGKFGNDNL